jgi:hypothetical protein
MTAMQRRKAIAILVGVTVAWPFVTRAQQKAMPVIGVLNTGPPGPSSAPFIAAFLQGLSEAGYVEGQNVRSAVLSAMSRISSPKAKSPRISLARMTS